MIRNIFANHGITITEDQEQKLNQYYDLLIDWNNKINLTSIVEYEEVIWKHFLDSAFFVLCDKVNLKETKSVLDLGTGAGFPGMVLAILCPDYKFVLADSLNKRIEFLKVVIDTLKLHNVSVIHGRAEKLGQDEKFRNQFDYVVSRAVAELPVLLEYCIPFVKKGGYFISYKSRKLSEEIENAKNALNVLYTKYDQKYKYELEYDHSERYLVFFECMDETDPKYPRKPKKIKTNPL